MNNMDSLYIEPVTEDEIIQLVNNAKNKTENNYICRYTTQTYFQHITIERDISR